MNVAGIVGEEFPRLLAEYKSTGKFARGNGTYR
jgi:hypothetical protein